MYINQAHAHMLHMKDRLQDALYIILKKVMTRYYILTFLNTVANRYRKRNRRKKSLLMINKNIAKSLL